MARIYFNDCPNKFMNIKFPPVATELIFSVQFERRDDYKGQFGFDWMRNNYESICNNYEELKTEYATPTISGKEYFVPWLSMSPNQGENENDKEKRVILKLKPTIFTGKPKKGDIVKLPTKNGIRFEPNEIKVKELVKETKGANGEKEIKGIDVTVFCDNALTEDTTIDLLDKYDNVVGKITLVKNDTTFNLGIKFVKVSREKHLKHLKEKFEIQIDKIDNFLQNNSLNQAFIKPEIIEKNYDLIEYINLDELPDEMFGKGRININSKGRKELKKRCTSINNFKGLVVFYLSIDNVSSRAGDTQTYPLNEQFVYLYLNSALNRDLAHEVGHALGLKHTFIETSTFLSKLEKTLENYNKQLQKNKSLINNSKYDQDSVSENIIKLNQLITEQKQKIVDFKSIGEKNPHKFEEGKSTNMMDYVDDYNTVLDFQHWQWLVMQKEIIAYYNNLE